jgi:hypothetical protein
MKQVVIVFVLLAVGGCAGSPHYARIHDEAAEILGRSNVLSHEVPYDDFVTAALFTRNAPDELALVSDLQPGATQKLDAIVWGKSSSHTAAVLMRALGYPALRRLPYLRLVFIGDFQDAERVRPSVEASGAKFFFRQK